MILLTITGLAMLILLHRAGWHDESARPAEVERHANRKQPALRQRKQDASALPVRCPRDVP